MTGHPTVDVAPPDPALRVSVDTHGSAVAVVRPHGEIDLATAPALRRHLVDALRGRRYLVVDLGGVTFLACSGLQCLLDAQALAVGRGGQLHLVGVGHRRVAAVLGITGLDGVLAVSDRPASVLAAELDLPHPRPGGS